MPVRLCEEIPVHRRIVHRAVQQGFEESLDGEDGCAEFMRNVPEEFTPDPLQLPLALEIVAERRAISLMPAASDAISSPATGRGTCVQIPACDRMRGARDLHDRSRDPACDMQTHSSNDQHDGETDDPDDRSGSDASRACTSRRRKSKPDESALQRVSRQACSSRRAA